MSTTNVIKAIKACFKDSQIAWYVPLAQVIDTAGKSKEYDLVTHHDMVLTDAEYKSSVNHVGENSASIQDLQNIINSLQASVKFEQTRLIKVLEVASQSNLALTAIADELKSHADDNSEFLKLAQQINALILTNKQTIDTIYDHE